MNERLLLGRIAAALSCTAALAVNAEAQSVLNTFNGIAADDRLGVSVACAGDVNNDGRPDYVAGAPEDGFVFNLREGYVRVYSGAGGGLLFTKHGLALAESFGAAVDGAGLVNNDPNADIVVGAPFAGPNERGRVQVISGASEGTIWTFFGNAGDELGRSVAGCGDVNNDGRDDVIAGAPNADPNAITSAGYVRVYSGLNGVILHTIEGTSFGQRVGLSVDGVGDLNGDDRDDFIVGSAAGATVYSGIDGTPLFGTFTALNIDDVYGTSVAGIGDFSGDGVPDFAIGATEDGSIFTSGEGYVDVRSGTTGALIHTFDGPGIGDRFGVSVAGGGDINGDGRTELMVGADQAGLQLTGFVRVFDGLTYGTLHNFTGDANNDQFGKSVDGCGDGNGNGFSEFVIGAPFASSIQQTAGFARVWETQLGGGGGCPAPENFCTTSPNSVGTGATISANGTTSVGANDLVLVTTGLPPSAVGIYFYGGLESSIPFGNGVRCVDGPELYRIGGSAAQAGVNTFPVNYGMLIQQPIVSGSTWKFQHWYRDVNGGGAQFNLSDGLSATFCD